MKFWQRMAHQFLKLRRQLRKRSKAIIALAAVVVFFTTYALILPAITEDAETAANDPAMSVGTTSVAGTDTAGEGGNGEVTEGSVDQQNPETAEENKEQPAQAETATETAAAENAEASDLISENTTLTDRNAESGYTISAAVTADAKFKNDTKLTTSEISKDKEETKDTYQAYLDKAQTALQATNTTVADAHFYDISFVSGTEKEEPQAAVTTTIQFDNPIELKDGQDIQIAHIDADNNLTILDKTAAAVATTETADHKIGSVSFNANQFSVYGVIIRTPITKESEASTEERKEAVSENTKADDSTAKDNIDEKEKQSENTVTGKAGEDSKTIGDVTIKVSYDEKAGLPEEAKLSVKEVSDTDQYTKATKEVLGNDVKIVGEKYFDISFIKDGKEIEPTGGVNVKITLSGDERLTAGNDVKVVHFADGKDTPDVLDATVTGGKVVETEAPATKNVVKRLLRAAAPRQAASKDSDSVVRFTADSFSIYGIAETTDTTKTPVYRRTYTFQNDDGTPYTFTLNKNPGAGQVDNPTDTQIVKNGERLIDVGTPKPRRTENSGKEFVGWGVLNSDSTVGNPQKISEMPAVSGLTSDDEVTLKAVFSNQINIVFHDENGAVIATKKATPSIENVVISDVTTEKADTASQDYVLIGWSTTKNATEAAYGTDSMQAPNANTNLYPVFAMAHWLTFDPNDDGDGSAYLVAPVRYAYNQPTQRPEDPSRKGYHFDGWFTTKNGDEEFTFGNTLSQNETIYAHWTPETTTYNVVIYKENINDNINTDESQKTYDYDKTIQVSAQTGVTVTKDSSDIAQIKQDIENKRADSTTDNYRGFHFAHAGITPSDNDPSIVVRGDGESVINLYYDRDLITMYFPPYQYEITTDQLNGRVPEQYVLVNGQYYRARYYRGYGYYYYNDENDRITIDGTPIRYKRVIGADTKKIQGLYGQVLNENEWPNGAWQYTASDSDMQSTGKSIMTEFILPDNARSAEEIQQNRTAKNIEFYDQGVVHKHIYYYLMDTNGDWPDKATLTGGLSLVSGSFTFEDQFQNYHITEYQFTKSSNNGWTSVKPGTKINWNYVEDGDLNIRYIRNQYDVEFYNGSNSTDSNVTKYYEADLTGLIAPQNLTYPGNKQDADHYEFVGWFTDPACTNYAIIPGGIRYGDQTFNTPEEYETLKSQHPSITDSTTINTMPGHNLPLYAGWKKAVYRITIDPNGGTFNDTESGKSFTGPYTFNVEYQDQINRIYGDADHMTREGYELTGLRVLLDEDKDQIPETPGDPWNFNAGVTDHVTIQAQWRSTATIKIEYDPVTGTEAPTDSNHYLDGGSAIAGAAPTAPTGYEFIGWDLVGKTYVPGAKFDIKADQASSANENNERIITLKAVYTKIGTTYIIYDYNVSGENGNLTDPTGISNNIQADLPLNGTTTLSKGSGFTRNGYVLAGWNTKADGTGRRWNLGEQVGINDDKDGTNGGLSDGGNKLYAVWAPIQKILKVNNKEGDEQKKLPGAVFLLTKLNDTNTFVNVTGNDFYGNVSVGVDGYTITSTNDNNGVNIGALKEGSYKLTETKAPSGYVVSTNDVSFSVDSKGEVTFTDTSNASYNANTHIFTIKNTPGDALPNTGGNGTRTFTILGLLLLASAGALITLKKKSIL